MTIRHEGAHRKSGYFFDRATHTHTERARRNVDTEPAGACERARLRHHAGRAANERLCAAPDSILEQIALFRSSLRSLLFAPGAKQKSGID